MNERDPRKVTAPVRHNPAIFSHAGQQMSLLDDAPEPMPVAPNPGTLAEKMLAMLATGAAVTSPIFEDATGSWRGASYVCALGKMGWLIHAERIPAPAPDSPERWIARYKLYARQIAIARRLRYGRGRI